MYIVFSFIPRIEQFQDVTVFPFYIKRISSAWIHFGTCIIPFTCDDDTDEVLFECIQKIE